jgi:hypothetical protein
MHRLQSRCQTTDVPLHLAHLLRSQFSPYVLLPDLIWQQSLVFQRTATIGLLAKRLSLKHLAGDYQKFLANAYYVPKKDAHTCFQHETGWCHNIRQ